METMKKLSLTFIAVVLFAGCQNEENKNGKLTQTENKISKVRKIQNNHEWDQVEEVVIGRWVKGTFDVPEVNQDNKNLFPYITDEAWEYFKPAAYKLFNETYPEDDQTFYDEQEAFADLVKSLGIKVHRPDHLEYRTIGTSQCYSRDPIITIGNKFIIANMYVENRRKETSNYRRLALELAKKYDGEVVNMPPSREGYPEENAYLEGGDVFVDGKNIYVGLSGNASNKKGVEWLKNELGDSYTVTGIPLKRHVLHLDCAMMLINETFGIICKDDFVNYEAVPERLKNRTWVEVKPYEAQRMATNGMVINPQTVIMIDAFPHVVEQVKEMGIKVYTVPFKKANYFGGGLRCSYQPIFRK